MYWASSAQALQLGHASSESLGPNSTVMDYLVKQHLDIEDMISIQACIEAEGTFTVGG